MNNQKKTPGVSLRVLTLCIFVVFGLWACTKSPGSGEILVKFFFGEAAMKDKTPEPGKGWFTKDSKKVPDSDFDVPEVANDIEIEARIDTTGKEVWIERIYFTVNDTPLTEPPHIEPPEGSKPNDLRINLLMK